MPNASVRAFTVNADITTIRIEVAPTIANISLAPLTRRSNNGAINQLAIKYSPCQRPPTTPDLDPLAAVKTGGAEVVGFSSFTKAPFSRFQYAKAINHALRVTYVQSATI